MKEVLFVLSYNPHFFFVFLKMIFGGFRMQTKRGSASFFKSISSRAANKTSRTSMLLHPLKPQCSLLLRTKSIPIGV